MEDRYAGDVGDFIKLGLLRTIASGAGAASTRLRVGLNWYLVPDEAASGDGGFISYLSAENAHHGSLRACDSELMAALTDVVGSSRSVAALGEHGALPADAVVYDARLQPTSGFTARQAWHEHALRALGTAEVVFADPDNGITEGCPAHRMHKYALVSELADYAARGQSVIAYHHADRSGPAIDQARRRLERLAAGTGLEPVGAVIGRRGSTRFFLVCAARLHASLLTDSVRAFAETWAPHVDLILP